VDIPEGEIFRGVIIGFPDGAKGRTRILCRQEGRQKGIVGHPHGARTSRGISAGVANERKEKKARAKARHNQLVRFLATAPSGVQEQAKAISFEELIMKCFEAGNVVSARQSLQPVRSLQRKQISRIIYNS
jgi:hypothetical protein